MSNWKRQALDLGIVAAMYVIAEAMRTQESPVRDWQTWAVGLGLGLLYRMAPELLTLLGQFRAQLGAPKPAVIGIPAPAEPAAPVPPAG